MAIGERIRFIRNLKGMTQKYLGQIIGFPEKTADIRMAQYESGTRTPKADVTEALAKALDVSPVANKIQLGKEGLGAGGNPDNGRKAAVESEDAIRKAMEGADMVFLTAGLGGGTGTGASPLFAKIAKELGCLTVGIVTKPFNFEGKKRMIQAEQGLEQLKEYVDSLIIISNNKVLEVIGHIPFEDAFKEADNILRQGVQTITDLIAERRSPPDCETRRMTSREPGSSRVKRRVRSCAADLSPDSG